MADEVEFRISFDYFEIATEEYEDENGNVVLKDYSFEATDYYYLYAEDEQQARSRALNDLRNFEGVEIWDVEEVD